MLRRLLISYPTPTQIRRTEKVEHVSPPGYSTNNQISGESVQRVDNNLLVKRSWDIALGPLRQVPMNLFIMYMAGTQVRLDSLLFFCSCEEFLDL